MTIETDYLVKGCGALGMGFVDVMLRETDASFVIVDRGEAPGGHWNLAYPFVTLHQPHDHYGLASRPIGDHRLETRGPNAGFVALPSGWQVADYFHRAMREDFLGSGRVRYFPMSELGPDGEIVSLVSGRRQRVQVRRKVVDATRLRTSTPLTHARGFEVEGTVACIPPHELPRRAAGHVHFVVLGGGKTGLDCLCWLLECGADPRSLTWVVPRDAWWSNRLSAQAAPALRQQVLELALRQSEAMAQSRSMDDLLQGMEASGAWLRLDRSVQPAMYHAATVSERELGLARTAGRVVRLGRVRRLEPERMVLEGGSVAVPAGTLFIDCTARALGANIDDRTPVFSPGRIDLNYVRFPMICLSVAVIACVEARVEGEDDKVRLCTPVPMTDTPADWVDRSVLNGINARAWAAHPAVRAWLGTCRLDVFSRLAESVAADDAAGQRTLSRLGELGPAVREAMSRLREENLRARGRHEAPAR